MELRKGPSERVAFAVDAQAVRSVWAFWLLPRMRVKGPDFRPLARFFRSRIQCAHFAVPAI